MSTRARLVVTLLSGLFVVALLVVLTITSLPLGDALLPVILFFVLIVFTTTVGVPLAGGRGSLLPMATAAAFLVLGPIPTAWVALFGALAHGLIRYLWAEQLREQLEPGILPGIGLAVANATIQVLSILAGGVVYYWAGGTTPLTEVSWSDLLPLVLFALTYLVINLFIVGLYFAARGLEPLKLYLRSISSVVLYEGWPMVFSPLMALVYTQLGPGQFVLVALAIIIASLVARGLSLSSQRLERRVKELNSLQAVGRALSASLDLDSILAAIHTQVAGLMPAHNFYVALYNADADEVSFPLAIEHEEQVRWRSRRTGNGLTEHILRTRTPLLIRSNYDATLEAVGIERIGQSATCWLGVPLLAGDEPLGVIAVQSYSSRQAYDVSHQEVLVTIAAQASVAIQNARLYARTDEALALRVQGLDSILRTTQEGVLLFDLEYRILAANRAVADLLSVAQLELLGQDLHAEQSPGEPPLAGLVGYGPGTLQKECQKLSQEHHGFKRQEIVIPGPPERYVERTLTPVRNRQGEITGWLLVFRDVTEEHDLTELRDDLMDMLIHDLRSPLTVMITSLELIKADLELGKSEALGELVQLAEKSGSRLLRLVNDLLDISRLESGNVTVQPRAVEIAYLMDSVATRLSPLAAQARIEVEISCEADLPPVYVDLELIDRVLHNLLDNALKFTPDGGHVQLWARADPEGAASILAGVTDTGPGIPPEAQPRLFKKFQQVAAAVPRRLGTGLGLFYCKLAVEAHGGEIWAESEVGKGSTFIMRLPTATDSVLSR